MPPTFAKPPARRAITPRHHKPHDGCCSGCPLEVAGTGYVPAWGNPDAPILLVGEGPWFDELIHGEPFIGAAGSMLTRILKLIGKQREDYRIDNATRCLAPGLELKRYPGAVAPAVL